MPPLGDSAAEVGGALPPRSDRAAEVERPLPPLGDSAAQVGRLALPLGVGVAEIGRPAPPALGTAEALAASAGAAGDLAADFFARLRYLGQLDCSYLVCEADGELVLVDQHGALERVAAARLRERVDAGQVAAERLLVPQPLALSPAERAAAAEHRDALAAAGVELAIRDGGAELCALPAGLRGAPAQVAGDILAALAAGPAPGAEAAAVIVAAVACHSVARAGDRLDPAEVSRLLAELDAAADVPDRHGRALLVRLPVAELARRFRL